MKPELLLDIVTSLRILATSLEESVATMLMDAEKDIAAQSNQETVMAVTLEQVRSVLAEKSMAGFTEAIRGLLEKYGAPRLSQIAPANYAALLADAEALT